MEFSPKDKLIFTANYLLVTSELGVGTTIAGVGGLHVLESLTGQTEKIFTNIEDSRSNSFPDIYNLMDKGLENGVPLYATSSGIFLAGALLIADGFRRAEKTRKRFFDR